MILYQLTWSERTIEAFESTKNCQREYGTNTLGSKTTHGFFIPVVVAYF